MLNLFRVINVLILQEDIHDLYHEFKKYLSRVWMLTDLKFYYFQFHQKKSFFNKLMLDF